MSRVPSKVKIIRPTSQFAGQEFDITKYQPVRNGRFYLETKSETGKVEWCGIFNEDEFEIVEWQYFNAMSTVRISDIDLGNGEIDFIYHCMKCSGRVDVNDKYCRFCGSELIK